MSKSNKSTGLTMKSLFYQIKSNPEIIKLRFNNQDYNRIKKNFKDEFKDNLSQSKIDSSARSKSVTFKSVFKKYKFNIDE